MSGSQASRKGEHLPLKVTRQIDALCDEFESSLAGSTAPSLLTYVEKVGSQGRQKLLEELVGLALEHLLKAGVVDPAAALQAAPPRVGAAAA